MKIVLVYFNAKLPLGRVHHSVDDSLLKAWMMAYRMSGTTLRPVLLTDSVAPACWLYDVEILSDCVPPNQNDVLNKVGWMKAQAFEKCGPCVVMDLDALIVKSIDHLATYDCPLAMAPDCLAVSWSEDVGVKRNAGVMVFNSSEIWPQFKALWTEFWPIYGHVTYFDELLFTIMNRRMGIELPIVYNYPPQDDLFGLLNSGVRVIHFSGNRKEGIKKLFSLYV